MFYVLQELMKRFSGVFFYLNQFSSYQSGSFDKNFDIQVTQIQVNSF